MPGPSDRLKDLGVSLPEPPKPVAAYIPAVAAGNLLIVSGQLPAREGSLLATGTVPEPVDVETARQCARQCVINALAAAQGELGSLERIRRVVRLGCFVASQPGFSEQPKVANGASELVQEIFGEAGRHARAAVGSVALPLGAPVEIEAMFEFET